MNCQRLEQKNGTKLNPDEREIKPDIGGGVERWHGPGEAGSGGREICIGNRNIIH